jgi:hypothetical protein
MYRDPGEYILTGGESYRTRGSKEMDGCPLMEIVGATLTVLVNSSHSRSSQRKLKVNIYAMRGILYNTCPARRKSKENTLGNPS